MNLAGEGNRRRRHDGAEPGPEEFLVKNYRRTIPKTKYYIQLSSGDRLLKGIEDEGLSEAESGLKKIPAGIYLKAIP